MRPIPFHEFTAPIAFSDVTMDMREYRVRRAGGVVHLGPTEFRLLYHFLLHPRQVFTREQLRDAVWEEEAQVDLRTVDAHILRLRRALNGRGGPDLVRTVRSVGYSLDDEAV